MTYVRLVPFVYSSSIAYTLEFGEKYIRVFYGTNVLEDSVGNEIYLSSPYITADLFELQFHQIADTLWIVHRNYAPRKLKRLDPVTFSLDEIEFNSGPFMLRNDLIDPISSSTTTMTYAGALTVGSAGTLTCSSNYFLVGHVGALFKMTYPRTITVSQLNSLGTLLIPGTGNQTPMQYSGGQGALPYTLCPAIDIKGTYTFATHGTWTGTIVLEKNQNNSSTWDLVRSTTVIAGEGNIQLSATESESNVQYRARVLDISASSVRAEITNNNPTQDGIVRVTNYTGATTVSVEVVQKIPTTDATIRWAEGCWSDVRKYPTSITFFEDRAVYAGSTLSGEAYGLEQIVSQTFGSFAASGNSSSVTVANGKFVDLYFTATKARTEDYLYIFLDRSYDGGTNWLQVYSKRIVSPGSDSFTIKEETADAIYRVRCALATTAYGAHVDYQVDVVTPGSSTTSLGNKTLQTVWLSKVSDYENFEAGVIDSDSFSLTLPITDEIRWVKGVQSLLLGTAGSEHLIASNKIETPLTPTNFSSKKQSVCGSSRIPPIQVANSVIFVDYVHRKVREMALSPNDVLSNKYSVPDLTSLAEHITVSGVTSMAFQKNPDTILWCTLNNGSLISMTYDREQNVIAWSKHPIDGIVISVAVIPEPDEDAIWISVSRTINGSELTYIEKFYPRLFGNSVIDSKFLDCSVLYDSTSVNIIPGMTHLAGETVSVFVVAGTDAVATVYEDIVVAANGDVTLPTGKNVTQALVGLPYTSKLQAMRLDVTTQGGATHGQKKKIAELGISLYNTSGVKYGRTDSELYDIDLTRIDWINNTTNTGLFEGDVVVSLDGGFDRDDRFVVVSDTPLPLTVRALVPRVEITSR